MKNGTANLTTRGQYELPCGLRCDLFMTQTRPDKPIVYNIEYVVDPLKFSEWLDSPEISWMCRSGPILFNTMGLRVMIPRKSERKSNKDVSWVIDSPEGTRSVQPFSKPVRFRIHRDILSNVEWSVYLDEMPQP